MSKLTRLQRERIRWNLSHNEQVSNYYARLLLKRVEWLESELQYAHEQANESYKQMLWQRPTAYDLGELSNALINDPLVKDRNPVLPRFANVDYIVKLLVALDIEHHTPEGDKEAVKELTNELFRIQREEIDEDGVVVHFSVKKPDGEILVIQLRMDMAEGLAQ